MLNCARPIFHPLIRNSPSSPILTQLKTLTTITTHLQNSITSRKDDYFAIVHHISAIVRCDFYLERTLNKLPISGTSDLVYRVLRSCPNSGTESFRFFNWARSYPFYPTILEYEELLKTLARTKQFQPMRKIAHRMQTLSPTVASFIIEEFGKHGLIDQAVEVFNKAKSALNCPQIIEVYNSLLFALCEVKCFHGAYALIRRMIRKGATLNKLTYSVLVNGWCAAGKMREAQDFLEEMSRKGFNPPVRG